ncbi:mitochondrial ribosomal protein L17 [Amylocystis lapponica]|nr:mitochondrial ribosomal protein L17 [Amylocystis lapponica]
MKHGVAFRKFSRTSSHRMLMLRNLVTSLFEHEQIKTTLPKARDTARLAEKIITMGKKGNLPAFRRANAFLLKPALVPKVFGAFAERYANRPGGYTRIHKFGNRPGDNAPHAILELVDNPRDLRFEMTARAVGWELLGKRLGDEGPAALAATGLPDVHNVVEDAKTMDPRQRGELRVKTRWNVQKVLRYRKEDAVVELAAKAEDHVDTLLARPLALKSIVQKDAEKSDDTPIASAKALRLKAGQTLPGGVQSTLRLAQAALGKEPSSRPRWFERRKLGVDKSAIWSQS